MWSLQGESNMTYQRITGTLMANSHPGSYCGQDAYNNMLVTENGLLRREWTDAPGNDRNGRNIELYARSTDTPDSWWGGEFGYA